MQDAEKEWEQVPLRNLFIEVDPAGIYFDENQDEYDPEIKALLELKIKLSEKEEVFTALKSIFNSYFAGMQIPDSKLYELAQKIALANPAGL